MDWTAIDMNHHVADIEQLRDYLEIERWTVVGVSWGSVLGLTYSETYPDRINALIVGPVSTGTQADIDWITVGCGRFYPKEWQAFADHVGKGQAPRLVDAYNDLLMDPNPVVHHAAAEAWCRWEEVHVGKRSQEAFNGRFADPRFRLGFARQVTHCWRNNSWLQDDQIVRNASRLRSIPGRVIHGRLDISGPLASAWRVHKAWAGSELVVVEGEGHGGPTMSSELRRAIRDLAR